MPRQSILIALSAVVCLLLQGCGVPATPPRTDIDVANVAGNWQIGVTPPQTSPSPPYFNYGFVGNLTQDKSNQVTGQLLITSGTPSCVPPTGLLSFSGLIDSDSALRLTSAPFSGNVISLVLDVPLNPNFPSTGFFTIAGGPCAVATTAVTGSISAPLQGTYVGALAPTLSSDPTLQTKLTITSAVIPDATGHFPFTGSGSFTSPTCNFTISSITGTSLHGVLTGVGTVDGQPAVTISFNGGADIAAQAITLSATVGTLNLGGQSCGSTTFQGVVTGP